MPGSGWGQTLWLLAMALFIVSFTMGGLNYVATIFTLRAPGASENVPRADLQRLADLTNVRGTLLLPFVTMPVLGVGVALALTGWIYSGFAIIAFGIIAPQLIKRSAPHFLLTQALDDAAVYEDVTRSGMLRVAPLTGDRETPHLSG